MSDRPASRQNGPDLLADGVAANTARPDAELKSIKSRAADPAGSERKFVLLLCALAVIHVFVFSAAFPFFNNVDEPVHFDLVLKYARGHVPRGVEKYSPDSSAYLALFSSCAFFGTPDKFPNHQMPPPPWTQPPDQMRRDFALNSAGWRQQDNYEVSQPPLYYALAACWWRAGQWLGLDSGHLLYWLRFLNIALVVAVVWLAYAAAGIAFPDNTFARLGPAILAACMPQTAFYSVGNDLLSAVCFGLIVVCVLKWLSCSPPSSCLAAATGLAFAATWLAKATNLPLLVVAFAALLVSTWRHLQRGASRATLPACASFLCCALPPILLWMIWCKTNFGDLTGSLPRTRFLGWTIKPPAQWWDHPIFTPAGFWTYLSGQLGTFWQGEFLWRDKPLALPGSNSIYTVVCLGLTLLALPGMFPRNTFPAQRRALQFSLISFVAVLVFFGLLSIIYDFHNCPYPSRAYPYFTSGRLMLGALVPFLLLIVYGLDRALQRFDCRTKFIVLGLLVSAMLASEIVTDWPVFSNPYNWFHLQ